MRYTIVITLLAVLFAASCIGKDNPDNAFGRTMFEHPSRGSIVPHR